MAKYADVDAYMAGLPDDRRAVMEQIRSTVQAAAPDAIEAIAYNMPAFRLNGRFLVSYEAFKRHYSLFPWSDDCSRSWVMICSRTPWGRARSGFSRTSPFRSAS